MRFARMIQAVDAHACGEPGRVIVGGVLDVPGRTMFDKMRHLQDHADGLRKLMLREPRGYPAANCNLILPPTLAGADAGYVIMEQTEYPGMSGTNTICVATVLLETDGLRDLSATRTTLEWAVPLPFDAGVWQPGRVYPKGAGVTVKGAWWIAQKDTSERPGDSRDYRLAVKGGRDGKDGKDGKDGE